MKCSHFWVKLILADPPSGVRGKFFLFFFDSYSDSSYVADQVWQIYHPPRMAKAVSLHIAGRYVYFNRFGYDSWSIYGRQMEHAIGSFKNAYNGTSYGWHMYPTTFLIAILEITTMALYIVGSLQDLRPKVWYL